MARLLVISRSMALGMRLADAHEVTERSPADLEAIEPDGSIDVILIDVGEPTAAIRALDSLRSSGHVTPVLLVSGYQPAWAGLVAVDLPGVLVVPLPITRAALFDGIATLARTDPDLPELAGTSRSDTPTVPDSPATESARREDAEPEHPVSDGVQPGDVQPGDVQPGDAAPDDLAPENTAPENAAPENTAPENAAPENAAREQARDDAGGVPAPQTPQVGETAAGRPERPVRPAAATGSPDPADGSRTADVVLPVLRLPPPGQFTGFDWWGLPLAEVSAPRTPAGNGAPANGSGPARPAPGGGPVPQNPGNTDAAGLRDLAEAQQVTLEQRRVLLGRPRRGGAVSALRRRLGERAAAAADPTRKDDGPDASGSPGATPAAGLQQPRAEQAGNPFAALPPVAGRAPGPQAPPPARSAEPATAPPASRAAVPSTPPRPGRVAPRSNPPGPPDAATRPAPATPTTTPLSSIRPAPAGPGRIAGAPPARTPGAPAIPNPAPPAPAPPAPAPPAPAPPAPEQPAPARTGGVHPAGAQQPGQAGWTRALEEAVRIEQAAAAAPVPAPIHDLRTLTLALSQRVEELYGVSDTAQVLADDVVERADADAAAVLVPDGAIWRVSGGVGLRPLERRLALDASHWLIENIAIAGQALMVEDTDIVRTRLAGAPLAAWRHLLAVPVPGIRAAVLLARGHEAAPFSEDDLNAVVGPAREAARLLQTALETRELARQLRPFAENDGLGR